MARPGNHGDSLQAILAPLGFILDLPGIILVPWEAVLGGPGFHFEGPGALHGSIFSISFQFCGICETLQNAKVSLRFSADFKASAPKLVMACVAMPPAQLILRLSKNFLRAEKKRKNFLRALLEKFFVFHSSREKEISLF